MKKQWDGIAMINDNQNTLAHSMKTIIQLFTLALILHSFVPLHGQEEEILITIGDTEITRTEFERIYHKNNQNLMEGTEKLSPGAYLDLFIPYKLKVIEAMNQGMDTLKPFREELAVYRKQLAAPYLTDMKYDEALIQEVYSRMTKEVHASHILFSIADHASAEEEQAVFQKAQKVKEEILKGKPFEDAAGQYSDDPSVHQNGGDLGYFSAFQMIAPFEEAAYNTAEGEISGPVRTPYGFHLIRLNDIRANQGEIKVAHIMKMFPGKQKFDKEKLKTGMDSIYHLLLKGAPFTDIARRYSDDKRSAARGGEMPWFSSGTMTRDFSEHAFNLKDTGDISPPVETAFGYHIIKKLDQRPVPPFEAVRTEIENKIRKDPARTMSSQRAFLEKLKKEYRFSENREIFTPSGTLNVAGLHGDNPVLFTIDETTYTLSDFKNYLSRKNITGHISPSLYTSWRDEEIIAFEDARLEKKYPEFRLLMQEYHDGLLLFNIMEEKIWNFAAKDSTGLEKFYSKNKKKFLGEERFDGWIFTCPEKEIRREAERLLDSGVMPEKIAERLLQNGKKIEIEEGIWEKGQNQVIDYHVWNIPASSSFDDGLTCVRGDIIPAKPKKLNEARGLYLSAYQDILEEEWLKSLRRKYKVSINKKLLKTIPDA